MSTQAPGLGPYFQWARTRKRKSTDPDRVWQVLALFVVGVVLVLVGIIS